MFLYINNYLQIYFYRKGIEKGISIFISNIFILHLNIMEKYIEITNYNNLYLTSFWRINNIQFKW